MDMGFTAKIMCDLSLWLTVSGFIYSYFRPEPMPYWPAGLMVLCCLLCSLLKDKKPPLRLLPLLALAACGFWMRGLADAVLLVPPCLYCAWVCVRGLFSPDYSGCCGYFKPAAVILPVLLLLAALIGGGPRVEKFALPYFLTFLFCGIAMLRLLRHDGGTRKEWRLWLIDFGSLGLCCAAALFLSSPLFLGAAGGVLGSLYRFVVQPLLMGVVYLMLAVVWLFEQAVGLFRSDRPAVENTPQDLVEDLAPELSGEAAGSGGEVLRQILVAVAVVAAVVVLAVFAFRLFRKMAGAAGRSSAETSVETRREHLRPDRARPALRSVLAPRTPRDTVRWYYRKFLLKARAAGMALRPSDTSESIARAAEALFDPALVSELRRLYLVARYSPDAVTAGDAKRARDIYGSLKT